MLGSHCFGAVLTEKRGFWAETGLFCGVCHARRPPRSYPEIGVHSPEVGGMHPETCRKRPGGHVGMTRGQGRSPLEVAWKRPEALWRDPETRAEALGSVTHSAGGWLAITWSSVVPAGTGRTVAVTSQC